MKFFKLPILGSFRKDEGGFVTVEAIFSVMFLSWWYVASFVFYDVYRQYIANVKATYTLGDLIARQADDADDAPFEADPFQVVLDLAGPSVAR